jgi:hypothetical protein
MIGITNTNEAVSTVLTSETIDSHNKIAEEITNLWSAHVSAKNTARATNEELRVLRAKLGEQLSEMKLLLAKPGRGGQWSSFLLERNIPRATADRLVARHQRSLNPDSNLLNEPPSEPTAEDVQKLLIAVWPRLRRTLRSRQSLELFVRLLASQFLSREAKDRESSVPTALAVTFGSAPSDEDFTVEPELESAPAR